MIVNIYRWEHHEDIFEWMKIEEIEGIFRIHWQFCETNQYYQVMANVGALRTKYNT